MREHPTRPVALLGDGGLLDRATAAALARTFPLVRPDRGALADALGSCAAVLVASDTADTTGYTDLPKAAEAAGVPWIPLRTETDAIHVGPVVGDACPTCADWRRRLARDKAQHHETLRARHGTALAAQLSPLRTRTAAAVAAELAVDLLDAKLSGRGGSEDVVAGRRPDDRFIRVDLASLAVSSHRYLPYSLCEDCGGLPPDGPEAARIVPAARPKPAPDVFRVQNVVAREGELYDIYVDPAAGVVPSVDDERGGPLPRAVAPLSSLRGNNSQHGWGRTTNYRTSRITAVLEALERFGGEQPRGRRTTVTASRRELGERALDPHLFGLYPDDRHDLPGFPYIRYHEDLVMPWVWGWSFARAEPVLVPERYAYYAAHSHDDPRFVYEISNGCAMGGCLEEAVLCGLLEVAERDAFLMTWYGRMPIPRVDPHSARDRSIPMMIEHLRHRTGYEVQLYSATLEQGVPCFWAVGLDTLGDPGRPRVLCAGGSALLAEKAVVNVLHEMAHLLEHAKIYDAAERERAGRMVRDPSLVKVMGDHSVLYSHEDAFDRFDFLLGEREARPFASFEEQWRWPAHTDLRADLEEMLRRCLDRGLDVVVVDQTTPEHRAGGFACVKVMVPGTLPMTFGHRNRRVDGIPRLLTVPYELGYRDRELTPADINPHPHPFP
ncbi:TOMM precursor leader peptide-binding protein [Streptomyces cinnabarinus]|uniref:TOMM leader peptide-binding protein n=1 Tax=Streptomyces cinnabarinus TaxID=67287 RepID=A0ABY7KPI3_9ACTN|nr:TOMM precursor leader peptide-binding protein [Streptomyces cinnabarinus]WAZ24784.1 TOMM precursor leader peptide-binding protein [Streptomyces cinnabarinus]